MTGPGIYFVSRGFMWSMQQNIQEFGYLLASDTIVWPFTGAFVVDFRSERVLFVFLRQHLQMSSF